MFVTRTWRSKDLRCIEMLSVKCEDQCPLATSVETGTHRGLEQTDAIRSGKRRNEHKVLRTRDVSLDPLEVGSASSWREELNVHFYVLTTGARPTIV